MIGRDTLSGTIVALVPASGVRMERPDESSQTIESDYEHRALSPGVAWRF